MPLEGVYTAKHKTEIDLVARVFEKRASVCD